MLVVSINAFVTEELSDRCGAEVTRAKVRRAYGRAIEIESPVFTSVLM